MMPIRNENILDEKFNENDQELDFPKTKFINSFGILIAKWSFFFGTLLFVLALIFKDNDGIIVLGFFYTVLAFILNLMFVFYLCIKQATEEEQKGYSKTAGIMALNIPIAFIYAKIILMSFS